MSILLGAIADDFTGATDLANTLVQGGMRVAQVIGPPGAATRIGDAQAVVVALKSRSCPPDEAVAQSLAALSWLRGQGAAQVLFKYCSTFDSTQQGNIGPVADALRQALDTDFTLVCPAFPENGRTVYQGHLFVGDQLLSDSPMKDHPLTPMRDASLLRLMAAQARGRVGLIPLAVVRAGPDVIRARIDALRAEGIAYGVADAICDDDLRQLGQAVADHPLITGGSGIALGLPDTLRAAGRLGAATAPQPARGHGRAVVLAGSCSQATRRQIAQVQGGWATRRINIDRIADGVDEARAAANWAHRQDPDVPVLIYGSADPDELRAIQARHGRARAGEMMEGCLGQLAVALHDMGFGRIVVAGGETSGAVVTALGIQSLRIAQTIAPGVPWVETLDGPPLALALKSGNFGGPDFFETAFDRLRAPPPSSL